MRNGLRIQLSVDEILEITGALRSRTPKNLLFFGTGHDSAYWHFLNSNGYSLFLEDDLEWVIRAKRLVPYMNIDHIAYGTTRRDWRSLLTQTESLNTGIPKSVAGHSWNVIVVDGPRGYEDSDPGRMKSIFLASTLAEKGADVFIHDCDREVERVYCDHYLSQFSLVSTVGRLRHYRKYD